MASRSLDIRLLGAFEARVDGQVVPKERWVRRKSDALVKLLALAPDQSLHREQIMESLWPETNATHASNSLNKALLMARRALEPELESGTSSCFLLRDGRQLRLVIEADGIDTGRFERAAERARANASLADFEDALSQYGGDLLREDPYAEWAHGARERLARLHRDLLLGYGDALEAAGHAQRAIAALDELDELVEREPAHETAHRRLMLLHWKANERDRALRQFSICRDALAAEVDAQPGDDTRRLYDSIVAGEAPPLGRADQRRAIASAAPDDTEAPTVIAVLPFVDADRETAATDADEHGDHDYLADGLTDGLIDGLTEDTDLRVIARSSVFRHRGDDSDPCDVGRSLGASLVACGSVRSTRGAAELQVDLELIRVADRSRRWAHRVSARRDELAQLQSDLMQALVAELGGARQVPQRRTSVRVTDEPEAHRDFLRGRFFWNKRSNVGLRKAIACFQSALDREPTYAAAYVGLADCYSLLGLYGLAPPERTMPQAKAAAQRALEIDDAFAEAYASLAYVQLCYDWDFEAAERGFRRALELSPNYATAHHWYHELLTARGRVAEQREQIRLAEALDPLSAIIRAEVGWALYFDRDYSGAEKHFDEALDLDPMLAVAHVLRGLCALAQDAQERRAEALEALEAAVRLGGARFPFAIAALGYALGRGGEGEAAEAALRRLGHPSEPSFVSRYYAAPIHLACGRPDQALDALEDAVRERCDRVIYLARDPLFDEIRDRARFRALIEEIGL